MGSTSQGVHPGGSLVGWRRRVERAQENPNAIPEGETPHNVTMLCYDEMVDTAKPGDRVAVTGIYKATALRVNPRQKALKARVAARTTLLVSWLPSGNIWYEVEAS